jgi:hypothetical protein
VALTEGSTSAPSPTALDAGIRLSADQQLVHRSNRTDETPLCPESAVGCLGPERQFWSGAVIRNIVAIRAKMALSGHVTWRMGQSLILDVHDSVSKCVRLSFTHSSPLATLRATQYPP